MRNSPETHGLRFVEWNPSETPPGMGLSRKIKSKRRNGGTQALREEAAKSGAGGGKWAECLPVKFEWFAAA